MPTNSLLQIAMLYRIGKNKINGHISDEIILSVIQNEQLEYKAKAIYIIKKEIINQ